MWFGSGCSSRFGLGVLRIGVRISYNLWKCLAFQWWLLIINTFQLWFVLCLLLDTSAPSFLCLEVKPRMQRESVAWRQGNLFFLSSPFSLAQSHWKIEILVEEVTLEPDCFSWCRFFDMVWRAEQLLPTSNKEFQVSYTDHIQDELKYRKTSGSCASHHRQNSLTFFLRNSPGICYMWSLWWGFLTMEGKKNTVLIIIFLVKNNLCSVISYPRSGVNGATGPWK